MNHVHETVHDVLKKISARSTSSAALLLAAVFAISHANADQSCGRIDAYWETNLSKLLENMGECDLNRWHKCSQAAAIHYDLNSGSLFQRAQQCGLGKPEIPGIDYTSYLQSDSQQCMSARDQLRSVFEDRAQARLACAAARAGGENQEYLNEQCRHYRSKMSNYHIPFRVVTQSCEIDYRQTVAWR